MIILVNLLSPLSLVGEDMVAKITTLEEMVPEVTIPEVSAAMMVAVTSVAMEGMVVLLR